MDTLLKKLNINETLTRAPKKQRIFNKVKDNIPMVKQYNYMCDILELPKTAEGFKYLLVVVDIATNAFDIEPMKTKESIATLTAMKAIFRRKYLKKPKVSMTTDSGGEFKSVFNKYLEKEGLDHRVSMPSRHQQMGNVENLNKQLGRLLNGFMNAHEEETDETYREWTGVIPIIREDLNEYRKNKIKKTSQKTPLFNLEAIPKYKLGEVVRYKLNYPENALGNKQSTENFRMGDYHFSRFGRAIVDVLIYPETPTYRYMLEGIKSASYSENELMISKNETASKYKVKQIIGKKIVKKITYYRIWWKGYKKELATWEPELDLRNDGLGKEIDAYNSTL